jgi:general stress protein YciG
MTAPSRPAAEVSADDLSSAKVLGSFTDYPGMLNAFRARATERKICLSDTTTAQISGLTDRYCAKLLQAPKPTRRFGMESLGPILGVLAVKLVMVEDPEAIARLQMLKERYGMELKVRDEKYLSKVVVEHRFTRRHMSDIGKKGGKATIKKLRARRRLAGIQRKGGKARFASMDAASRSALGRMGAKARWAAAAANNVPLGPCDTPL